MYICEYCGRYLKEKVDKCPGCGGSKFTKTQNIGEIVIKNPPKGGYKVNLVNFKEEKKAYTPLILIGVTIFISILFFSLSFFKIGKGNGVLGIPFILFGIFAIISGFIEALAILSPAGKMRHKSNKNMSKIKQLSQKGILIKNLRYSIKPVDNKIDGPNTVYYLSVVYEIEKGKTMNFKSEPKYLTALGRDNGTVDLLIDPNDYTNYFIDFEIY